MTTPRRFAALAVCLLALASGAAAGPCDLDKGECGSLALGWRRCVSMPGDAPVAAALLPPECPLRAHSLACCHPSPCYVPHPHRAGSITLELVQAASALKNNEIATCLSSLTINLDTDCGVTIGAPAADNSFLQSQWTSDGSATKLYKLCPASSPTAPGATQASILKALNSYAYGVDKDTGDILKTSDAVLDYSKDGVLKVTFGTGTDALIYAVRAATTATVNKLASNLVVANPTNLAAAGLAESTEFLNADNIGLDCPAGTYGLPIGETVKLCPLCPAGTFSDDGNGCRACSAGFAYGSVGLNTECDIEPNPTAQPPVVGNQCPAGTYSPEGELSSRLGGGVVCRFCTV